MLGLLRGSHSINYAEGVLVVNTISDSYYLCELAQSLQSTLSYTEISLMIANVLPLNYLGRFNAAFGLSAAAILVSLLNLGITLLNSYQSVTTWWKGPSMMYLLSLFASNISNCILCQKPHFPFLLRCVWTDSCGCLSGPLHVGVESQFCLQ